MDQAARKPPTQRPGEICPRCLRPVEFQALRCENCGQPITGHRNVSLWFGVGGVGALVFLVVLMWMVVHNEDVMNAPVPVDPQSQKEELLPDTSKTDKATEPAKPEKPPPLNQ